MGEHESVATLMCGCEFEFTNHDGVNPIKIGDYFSCSIHSLHYGYDPDDGSVLLNRDQKIIRIDHFSLDEKVGLSHKIERDGRGGYCVNEGCTLNLTFLSSIDVTYLENNQQCPTGPLKKLMRQPTPEEIVGDHSTSQRIHALYEDALEAMRKRDELDD